MLFFIDIGNTRIKYAANHKVLTITAIDYKHLQVLLDVLHRQKADRLLLTAGRSDKARHALSAIQTFARQNAISSAIVTVKPGLLNVNYSDNSQFGEDRFLHLLAARQRFTKHFCVVSCGTAITIDFYTDQHIGGMIAPGLGMAKTALSEKAGLHHITKPTTILGNDTASSIGSGLYFGYQHLIDGSISQVEKTLHVNFQLVFTGGDAELLAINELIIPELLFEGMRIYDHDASTG